MNSIKFRQLFDEKTWTYTYIVADSETKQAIIIDPVRDQVERDMRLLSELGLMLTYILDTHIHADHITGSGIMREKTGAKIALGEGAAIAKPDILLRDGEILTVGNMEVKALSTPGHTEGCTSFVIGDMLFSGDVLFIRKTGRTDFQQGSPEKMYHSIKDKMYTLPDDTKVYPGHDYAGHMMSTIGEEKQYNSRIKSDTTLEAFTETMNELHLPAPKFLDVALRANLRLGLEA
jgi:sulfur dioxygenase